MLANPFLLQIKRNQSRETTDALFGDMAYDGRRLCFTMERKAVAIPEGIYRGRKRDSPRFGMRVLGIEVPSRTDIEVHPANYPRQLGGCIAVGESIGNDALDSSRAAFGAMMSSLPEEFTVVIA